MAEGLQPEFAVPPDADTLLENDAGAFAVANYREPADISEYNQLDMIDGAAGVVVEEARGGGRKREKREEEGGTERKRMKNPI
jgi:hypothetical protein